MVAVLKGIESTGLRCQTFSVILATLCRNPEGFEFSNDRIGRLTAEFDDGQQPSGVEQTGTHERSAELASEGPVRILTANRFGIR